jgi:hypothetical protein
MRMRVVAVPFGRWRCAAAAAHTCGVLFRSMCRPESTTVAGLQALRCLPPLVGFLAFLRPTLPALSTQHWNWPSRQLSVLLLRGELLLLALSLLLCVCAAVALVAACICTVLQAPPACCCAGVACSTGTPLCLIGCCTPQVSRALSCRHRRAAVVLVLRLVQDTSVSPRCCLAQVSRALCCRRHPPAVVLVWRVAQGHLCVSSAAARQGESRAQCPVCCPFHVSRGINHPEALLLVSCGVLAAGALLLLQLS